MHAKRMGVSNDHEAHLLAEGLLGSDPTDTIPVADVRDWARSRALEHLARKEQTRVARCHGGAKLGRGVGRFPDGISDRTRDRAPVVGRTSCPP